MADDAIILTRAAGEGDRPGAARTVEGAQSLKLALSGIR